MNFKAWLILFEAVNINLLTKMWKKFFPTITDEEIKQKINIVTEADPTPNKEYVNWLTREVLNNRLRLPEDVGVIQPDIELFHDLKRRNQLRRYEIEPNIERYDRYQFQQMVDVLKEKAGLSNRQAVVEKKTKGAEKLYQDDEWMVIKSTTEDACVAYGKGTKWCTAAINGNMANHYLEDGPLYIIWHNKQPYAQFHTNSDQFMDVHDSPVDIEDLPERLKEILWEVVPRESEDDYAFFYKMTGKLDEKVKEQIEDSVTPIAKNNNFKLDKLTSTLALKILEPDVLADISRASTDFPVYSLKIDKNSYYWQFALTNNRHYLGRFVNCIMRDMLYCRSYPLGTEDDYTGKMTILPEQAAEIANKYIIPQSLREGICLYYLTGEENKHSTRIFIDHLKHVDINEIIFHDYNIYDNIYSIYKYFTNTNEYLELAEVIKIRIEEYEKLLNKQEAENQEHADYLLKTATGDKKKQLLSRFKFKQQAIEVKRRKGLGALNQLIASAIAKNPTKPQMEYLVNLAKRGNIMPLWVFWKDIVYYAHHETDNPINPPWGQEGWLEAEPYLATYAAYAGLATYAAYARPYDFMTLADNYAKLTDNPKATLKRFSAEFFEKAEKHDELERQRQQEEDEMQ